MSTSRLIAPLIAFAGLVAGAAQAMPVPSPGLAVAQVRAINQRFVESFFVEDGEFLEALAAEDFRYLGPDGHWLDRATFLARMRHAEPLEDVSCEDVRVRLYGSAAVVHAVFSAAPRDGQPAKLRYTDVFIWDGSGWRLVSAQTTPIKDGVAVRQNTAAAPQLAPWHGPEPAGDDLEVLRALNEHYVQAFRAADASWYDAHLAPDYVVVFGDGSFHDRNAALADFAVPYFATHIRSFPVDGVSIRRYGDLALIHAENDYELQDGRTGVNRYTDIWHRQAGQWRCIAAHITVHKPATA